jgi:hypothetical protein
MSGPFTLESVDKDGAIQEMAHAVAGDTRADFMRKAVIAGGAFAGGAAVLAYSDIAGAQTASDVAILNFALTLEYLEAAFYIEAVAMGALSGETLRFARVVKAHEVAHVNFLKKALKTAAVPKPTFDFKGTTEDAAKFRATAKVLEDTGVMAYAGQAPLVKADAVLQAALSVHTVEARHAAWIRHILGQPPSPVAFDPAKTKAQILAAVTGTGFIVAAPATSTSGSPTFAG